KKSEYRHFVEELDEAHLKVVFYEDALRLKVDYEELLEEYGEELTEAVRGLLSLQALAVEEPMMEKAVLQISWEKVLDRAYTAETLLRQFGEEELIRMDALELYKLYLNTLLMGTTNTPVIDYKTGVFSEGAKTIYKDFLLDHPESTVSWVLTEYFTYLEKVGYTVDYTNGAESKVFFDTCDWLVSQAEKRVMQ
ncbi:MAG: hypothetical protein IJC68_03075, partial [Firmicutes bacterium]|nr:hypothetical protein [Bacillota bacterium]